MQRPCDSNIKQLCLPCIVPVMVLIRFPEDHRIELQTFGQRDRENHHAVMERGTVILFFKQGFFQKDSLADQSERRGVIKIQFAFGG